MSEFKLFKKLCIGLLLAAIVSSCSKSPEPAPGVELGDSLLRFVPADSPYVLANPVPLPDEVLDQLEPRIDQLIRVYAQVIRAVVDDQRAQLLLDDDVDEDEVAKIDAMTNEVASLMTLDGLRGAGIGRRSTSVLYGEGLLPVLRMTLTDGTLMEQAISRIEKAAGSKMSVSKIGEQSYRFAGDDDAGLIVAIVGDDLVVSIVPADHSDELLKSVLGLTKPAKSIVVSGELQTLMAENDFEPYYLMLLDGTRVASTFLDDQTGTNRELLSLMDYDAATISDVCKTEIRELAGVVPRLTGGYTEISTERWASAFLLEIREDIAKGLTTLVAPVQGLGTTEAGLFSFGMSLDLLAARTFYAERLDESFRMRVFCGAARQRGEGERAAESANSTDRVQHQRLCCRSRFDRWHGYGQPATANVSGSESSFVDGQPTGTSRDGRHVQPGACGTGSAAGWQACEA